MRLHSVNKFDPQSDYLRLSFEGKYWHNAIGPRDSGHISFSFDAKNLEEKRKNRLTAARKHGQKWQIGIGSGKFSLAKLPIPKEHYEGIRTLWAPSPLEKQFSFPVKGQNTFFCDKGLNKVSCFIHFAHRHYTLSGNLKGDTFTGLFWKTGDLNATDQGKFSVKMKYDSGR
mmetsp:Transcript_13285/g.16113  ORF Transcript_13285/g.16113 Transcript_13285/m.16113 type:complete len:171 (+) Transcript_13285:1-513(+)